MAYTELTALSIILTHNQPIKNHVPMPSRSPTPWHSIAHHPVPASLTSAPESKPRESTISVDQDKFVC